MAKRRKASARDRTDTPRQRKREPARAKRERLVRLAALGRATKATDSPTATRAELIELRLRKLTGGLVSHRGTSAVARDVSKWLRHYGYDVHWQTVVRHAKRLGLVHHANGNASEDPLLVVARRVAAREGGSVETHYKRLRETAARVRRRPAK